MTKKLLNEHKRREASLALRKIEVCVGNITHNITPAKVEKRVLLQQSFYVCTKKKFIFRGK